MMRTPDRRDTPASESGLESWPGPRPQRDGVRRVLAVRLDNIGDVILLGPALRALREAFPAAEITLLASPAGAQAVPLLPWIDRVIEHRAPWQDASGAMPFDADREQAFVAMLRREAFDAAFIFTSFSQSAFPAGYACYLAGIPIRAGHAAGFGGAVLSHQIPPPPLDLQQAERNLHLLEQVGVPVQRRDLEVAIPLEAELALPGVLHSAGLDNAHPYFAVVPGASASARRYPSDQFVRAAAELAGATGLDAVLAGRQQDLEASPGLEHVATASRVRSVIGRTDVSLLAAILRGASLVLANNSLAMHLADALRRPVVAVFSGTDLEAQWRPRDTPHVLLRRPTSCSPCYAFDCPFHLECLDVPPAAVTAAALSLLNPPVDQATEGSTACAS